MKHLISGVLMALLLTAMIGTSQAAGSGQPRVAERVGKEISIDQLPDIVAELVRAEVGDDATQVILRVTADNGDRYEIAWEVAGASIRTAFSPEGAVLWREVKLAVGAVADMEEEGEDDEEEEGEQFERPIAIDLVPEPAKAAISVTPDGEIVEHESEEIEEEDSQAD
jgi:hypothetical protein